jgi:hypothetical protein
VVGRNRVVGSSRIRRVGQLRLQAPICGIEGAVKSGARLTGADHRPLASGRRNHLPCADNAQ